MGEIEFYCCHCHQVATTYQVDWKWDKNIHLKKKLARKLSQSLGEIECENCGKLTGFYVSTKEVLERESFVETYEEDLKEGREESMRLCEGETEIEDRPELNLKDVT